MLNVDNKSAVERLAAVVVMLERREAEARKDYNDIRARITAEILAGVPALSEEELNAERMDRHCAHTRWIEARDALTAARELAPRDL